MGRSDSTERSGRRPALPLLLYLPRPRGPPRHSSRPVGPPQPDAGGLSHPRSSATRCCFPDEPHYCLDSCSRVRLSPRRCIAPRSPSCAHHHHQPPRHRELCRNATSNGRRGVFAKPCGYSVRIYRVGARNTLISQYRGPCPPYESKHVSRKRLCNSAAPKRPGRRIDGGCDIESTTCVPLLRLLGEHSPLKQHPKIRPPVCSSGMSMLRKQFCDV
ncbi:hypothetical protein HPB51_004400 [Rhipicephalus microplus]|uniref:Uncharacterized protein n=1 Tax=Rhipicephalus microplus TaxID=6941 RepID=A0A9J6ELM3_RHIMP|nr:hypothetical protein HPB51_004400 [Rhipicephalus microplus]